MSIADIRARHAELLGRRNALFAERDQIIAAIAGENARLVAITESIKADMEEFGDLDRVVQALGEPQTAAVAAMLDAGNVSVDGA